MDMCARTETNTNSVLLHTRHGKHKSLDLLDLSHDACIVRVSDKTLFILRERISQARDGFQITTWHCRIHRLMCSPSNSQSRSKHRETDEQTGRREQARNKGQNLLALPCKTHGQQRENKATPLFPHTNRRTCSLDNKNCVRPNGYNGKVRQHKDVHGSVSSCSLSRCEFIQNLFPRMCTTVEMVSCVCTFFRHA